MAYDGDELLSGYIPPVEGQTYSSRWGGPAYGGEGGEIHNGKYVPGTSGADKDAKRFQYMAGRQLDPVWIDRTQSDESRGFQMGSLSGLQRAAEGGTDDQRLLKAGAMGESADMQRLGEAAYGGTADLQLLEGAARGTAPSRAEILGKQMSDRALRSQVSAAGTVRGGPGATAAAYRASTQNAASTRADMNAGIQAERAAEMAAARHDFTGASGAARRDFAGASGAARGAYGASAGAARGAYAGAATDVRGQDIGLATSQAGLGDAQRGRDDRREMYYEGMASDTKWKNLEAEQTGYFGEEKQRNVDRDFRARDRAQDWGQVKDTIGMASGATSGGMSMSDVRSKTNVRPVTMGSLSKLDAGAQDPNYANGIYRALPDQHARQKENRDESIVRDFPEDDAPDPAWLDRYMRTEGERDTMGSDDRTKLEAAWNAGARSTHAMYKGMQKGPGSSDDHPGGAKPKAEPFYEKHISEPPDPATLERIAKMHSGGKEPNQSKDPRTAEKSPKKGLVTTSATRIDPSAHGEAPPKSWEQGGSATARGKDMTPPLEGLPKDPITGEYIYPPSTTRGPYASRDTTPSDEQTKKVRDFGEVDDWEESKKGAKSAVRDLGDVEDMPEYEGRTFHRDTPEDERRVKRKYEDDAGREADKTIAAYRSADRGASVSLDGGEVDDQPTDAPAPWLTAFMESRNPHREVAMSDKHSKNESGAATDAMASAARAMEPSIYTYKSSFTPETQKPGEVNVGPMANKMAENPVARTAIVKDDETGMLAIDKDKGLKVVMGSLASMQHQIDALSKKKRAA